MEQLNPSFGLRNMPPMIPQGLGNPSNQGLMAPGGYGGSNFNSIRPQLPPYSNEQD